MQKLAINFFIINKNKHNGANMGWFFDLMVVCRNWGEVERLIKGRGRNLGLRDWEVPGIGN
jgi:hypothetical protein